MMGGRYVYVENFAQIREARLEFGDLTIFVGPQASGKSLLLQLFKLAVDRVVIARTIRRYGFDWDGDAQRFFSLYFGSGLGGVWRDGETRLVVGTREYGVSQLVGTRGKSERERVFLIPAQRVLTLRDGWPRDFMSYGAGDPFVVRQFSEHLRQLMEAGLGRGREAIFPQKGRMAAGLRWLIDANVFVGAKVQLETGESSRKAIVLELPSSREKLSYMSWSAGQREFLPLLLGLYWLMPSSHVSRRPAVEWVAIEEPEMGLHPQAISAFLVVVLELLRRGYKVIITTHSPQLLELVWGLQHVRNRTDLDKVLTRMLPVRPADFARSLAQKAAAATFRTYLFARGRNGLVTTKDISSLDATSKDPDVADWGGLTSFATRISDVVAESYSEVP